MLKNIYVPLLAILFTANFAKADTVFLKNERELKGLVVEEYEDRILVSIPSGELMVERQKIERIEYDEPAYSFLSLGRQMEAEKRWEEALSYYQKALELNPDLKEAKEAALGIQSKAWARLVEGPSSEVAMQQAIQDSWNANVSFEQLADQKKKDSEKQLWDRMGLKVALKGDWPVVEAVRRASEFSRRDLLPGDEIASIDGKSLRYLSEATVIDRLLEPRYSSAVVQIHRVLLMPRPQPQVTPKELGFAIRQDYNGLFISKVDVGGAAELHGLQEKDILLDFEGNSTRYLPLNKALEMIRVSANKHLSFKINRSVTLSRK